MKFKGFTAMLLAAAISAASLNIGFASAGTEALNTAVEDDILSGSATELTALENIDDNYDGGYIVKIKDNVSLNACSLDTDESEYGFITTDSLEQAEAYVEQGFAEYIEPDYPVELCSVPNDALYSEQWQHTAISSQDAWDLELYGDDVKIAVIDTGCYNHEDIDDNLYDGYNYLDSNTDLTDSIGHGTHVSGIIAAEMNSIGVVGLASNAKIVMLKCFDDDANTRLSYIIKAIYAAVDEYDCDIINMSWGVDTYSRVLYETVEYAYNKGVIMIASAGNGGTTTLQYPAAFDCVIGVGSVNSSKTVSSSSRHNSSVFAAAPGEDILSLGTDGGYAEMSGTSMAAPMVTALAAVLKGIDSDMTFEELEECIKSTSKDLGSSGYDYYYGYGLIDAGEAVRYMLSDEYYYISDITNNDGKINYGIWNNTGSELSGVKITEAYSGIYADNIDVSQISLSSDETGVYEYSYSGDYDSIKCFIWNSIENMMPVDEAGVNSETEITITDAELDSSGNITLKCSAANAADNQQLSIMVVKYDDGSFDYDNIAYYNQVDYTSDFEITFNASIYDKGTYALRVGGTGVSEPVYVLLSYENVTSTATTTTTTTTTTTEATTETTTSTTETTTKKTSSGGSGGGGGGGSSSSSATTTTATTTTEATTVEEETEASTEEETEAVTEEADSTAGISSVSGEIKVTIGSNVVYVNENAYNMEAVPYIQSESNSTLVPLRFVAVAIIGGNVDDADLSSIVTWYADTKTASITSGDNIISFTAGSSYMTVNGEQILMNNGVSAEITDGRMFIPFRALGEALGVSVDWDAESKTAIYLIE